MNEVSIASARVTEVALEYQARTSRSGPWPSMWWPLSQQRDVHLADYYEKAIEKSPSPNAQWKSRLSKGEVVIGPYATEGRRMSISSADTDWAVLPHATNSLSRTRVRRIGCPVGLPQATGVVDYNPPLPTSYDVEALLRAETLASVKSGAMTLLVTLAESPKTFRMIGNTARRLANLLTKARKALLTERGRREFRRLLRESSDPQVAASLWLEWRYGYRVLIFEIESAFEALSELQSNVDGIIRRERSRDEEVFVETTGSSGNASISVASTYYERVSARAECLSFYTLDMAAMRHRSLTLSLAPTIWELIPFSFVLDWFVNIGTLLTAYATVVPGLVIKGSQYGVLVKARREHHATHGLSRSTVLPLASQPKPSFQEKFSFVRKEINIEQPVLPSAFNGLTVKRALDAVALATNLSRAFSNDVQRLRI